jgi:hypothetical protein
LIVLGPVVSTRKVNRRIRTGLFMDALKRSRRRSMSAGLDVTLFICARKNAKCDLRVLCGSV